MKDRERIAEISDQVYKIGRDRCDLPGVLDEELKDFVNNHKQDEELGFHCRHIVDAIERFEKAEREYVHALSVLSDRVNWLPELLRR